MADQGGLAYKKSIVSHFRNILLFFLSLLHTHTRLYSTVLQALLYALSIVSITLRKSTYPPCQRFARPQSLETNLPLFFPNCIIDIECQGTLYSKTTCLTHQLHQTKLAYVLTVLDPRCCYLPPTSLPLRPRPSRRLL